MPKNRRIYLDCAATTPLDPRVWKVMEPFFSGEFGNPSSLYAEGVAAKRALDEARALVARVLEARPDEIVFTSGGTEANNLAIRGVLSAAAERDSLGVPRGARLAARRGRRRGAPEKVHAVTTNIEHASVLEPLRELERRGSAEVTYIPVSADGTVNPEQVVAAVRPNTALVSVMYANNEIGTVQPIRKIAQALRNLAKPSSPDARLSRFTAARPVFHTDACQAPLYLHCLVNALGVDLLTLDGHKIYGPKGVGCLYVWRGTPLAPILFGGGQEGGLRSTTENVAGIVGFAEALRIAAAAREKESGHIQRLRDCLYSHVLQNIGIEVVVNGSMRRGERLPNNLNLSLPGVDTEFLALQLDAAGIAVSTKSSCLRDERDSHVVAALGRRDRARARSTIRFTLGRGTTAKDIADAARTLTALFKTGRRRHL